MKPTPARASTFDVSTLGDHVGAAAAVLSPLAELIRRHVFTAERVHGDDELFAIERRINGLSAADRLAVR